MTAKRPPKVGNADSDLIVSLLGKLSDNVKDTRELGRKFGILEQAKQSNKRGGGIFGSNVRIGDDNGQEEDNPFADSINGFGIL